MPIVKLLTIFVVAFSLAALTGAMASDFHLPSVPLGHAVSETCEVHGASGACSHFWYPAGPAMDGITTPIFNDPTAEYTSLQSASPLIDFTDSPCSGTPTTGVCGSLTTSTNFITTAPVANTGYYEIEFHLGNVFWNCNFNFGTSGCGIDIRQGLAHLYDKVSFCTNSVIAGTCTPLDVPVPTTSGGGLLAPNPCAYDARFPQSGSNCIVGSPGGTAYHLAASGAGANGSKWLYAPGSPDLNAAAAHLVAAGAATGFNPSTSILTGPVTTNTPSFFIRDDDAPRHQLGQSLASQICYVFTGSYNAPCLPYLQEFQAPVAFPGFTTSKTAVNLNWWMYTAGFSGPTFFDGSLYFTYNSRFVSGVPSIQSPTGMCDSTSVPTSSAPDYIYACVPTYDSLTTQMDNSPCLTAPGDPALGSPNNGPGGHCTSDPTKLSAISAGVQAEAVFAGNELTIPALELTFQFGYQNNGWLRAINSATVGLPNYFTWLNAWNPSPHDTGTLRQGWSETTHSVNPYLASTPWDRYIVNSVYDPLIRQNPLAPSQILNWMVLDVVPMDNATVMSRFGYAPPPGTVVTYHFAPLFGFDQPYFQDGRPVTAWDVAFSYLSEVGSGAFLGSWASSMTGITVLGPNQFDIGVSSRGPFTLPNLGSIPILPGRYWTGAGSSAWDAVISSCTGSTHCQKSQYSLSGATVTCPSASGQPGCPSPNPSASMMQVDPIKTTATYDPIANHILIGSGPWQCGVVTNTGSGNCSSSGAQNPPQPGGSYFLTRYGTGLAPASSTSGIYFRSSGKLALYIWSGENDVSPILALSSVLACIGVPVNPSGGCAHWQQGIGRSATGVAGINQISIVLNLYNISWVRPFSVANLPLGMASFTPAPVLYEGSVTLNPCSIDPVNGYDC